MTQAQTDVELLPLDTSDVDRWMGKPVGGGELKEPIYENDIRRFVQAQHNPNRLHYDEKFAAASVFGGLVAPQSFAVVTDISHGASAAIQGTIPGSHMLFGGDEWWFHGPRIYPGDFIRPQRLAYDYRVTNTSFAGPTMFQRGDTTYINQHGEVIGKQRSTSIRYLVENSARLKSFAGQESDPEWTDEQLDELKQEQLAYFRTFAEHVLKTAGDAEAGEQLPTRKLGPHSLNSFTTEYKALMSGTWGVSRPQAMATSTSEAGWVNEMASDAEKAQVNPQLADGINYGPSRGHVQAQYAQLIGMPRGYGYGASMGVWVLDYVANWAGESALIMHSKIQYRNPALTGDVTVMTGEVTSVEDDPLAPGHALVTVEIEMKTHAGQPMAKGPVEVRLPHEV
jgi:acyl dehydratase